VKEKQPYAIALADGGLTALAGLWETWATPAHTCWDPYRNYSYAC
jgi:putative SOS response-associated peptidase YedK